MNHASREMLGRIYMLDDGKFPAQLLASVMSLNLQSTVNFSLKTFVSTTIDFVLVFATHEVMIRIVKHLLFMNSYKADKLRFETTDTDIQCIFRTGYFPPDLEISQSNTYS